MSGWRDYGFDDGLALTPYMTAWNGLVAAAMDCGRFPADSGGVFCTRHSLETISELSYYGGLERFQEWQAFWDDWVKSLLHKPGSYKPEERLWVRPSTFSADPASWSMYQWDTAVSDATGGHPEDWMPSAVVDWKPPSYAVKRYILEQGSTWILRPSSMAGWALQRRRLLDLLYLKAIMLETDDADLNPGYSSAPWTVDSVNYTVNPATMAGAYTDARTNGFHPYAVWRSSNTGDPALVVSSGCYRIKYTRQVPGSTATAALHVGRLSRQELSPPSSNPLQDPPFSNPFFSEGWNVRRVGTDGVVLDEAMADSVAMPQGAGSKVDKIIVVEDIEDLLEFKAGA